MSFAISGDLHLLKGGTTVLKIPAGSLPSGAELSLSITMTTPGMPSYGMVIQDFIVNAPPSGGTFEVAPMQGIYFFIVTRVLVLFID